MIYFVYVQSALFRATFLSEILGFTVINETDGPKWSQGFRGRVMNFEVHFVIEFKDAVRGLISNQRSLYRQTERNINQGQS